MRGANGGPTGQAAIPSSIVRSLTSLIRRLRTVILLRGVSATLATAVGAVLAVMAIDAGVMLFSQTVRWLLTLLVFGATAFVAVRYLILPLAKTFSLAGIARAIETRHPELHERLSSAVELLTSRDMPQIRGSDVLIAELVKQASHDADRVRPTHEITLRSARPFLLAAGATVLVLALAMALAPSQASRLLARAVAPYLNLPNVSADQLTIRPGDARLLQGDSLEIEAVVANRGVAAAELRKIGPDGSEKTEAMASAPAPGVEYPRFVLTNPAVSESFRYRIRAGDALSRYYNVTVVQPPFVTKVEVRYEYPAYMNRPPAEGEAPSGKLSASAGTQAAVAVVFDKPVVSAQVLLNGQEAPDVQGTISRRGDGSPTVAFRLDLASRMQGIWALRVVDGYGFTSKTADYPLEVSADLPPTVHILAPEEDHLRLKPQDRLPIRYALEDDYGIAQAELQVEAEGRKLQAIPVPLPASVVDTRRAVLGDTMLDLGALPLRGAQRLTFRLRTLDNLPNNLHGPQEGLSDIYTVELDASAASYAQQMLSVEEQHISASLEKILQELLAAKKDSATLKNDLLKVQSLDNPLLDRLGRIRKHLQTAEATALELASDVFSGPYTAICEPLMAVAGVIRQANDQADRIPLTDNPQQRSLTAGQADADIDRAIEMVRELMKQFEQMMNALHLAQNLEQMALEEVRLAELMAAIEASAAEPGMTPEEWAKLQEELNKALAQMLQQNPDALAAALASAAEQAKALAEEILELKTQQDELAKETGQLEQLDEAAQAQAAQGMLEQLQTKQAELAAEAKQLAGEAAAAQAPATPTSQQAAQSAQQAADQLQTGNLSQAAQSAQQAAQQLGQTADQLAQQARQEASQQMGQTAGQEATAQAAEAAKQAAEAAGQAAEAAAQAVQQAGQQAGEQAAQAAQQAAQAAQQAAQAAQQAAQTTGQEAAQAAQQAGQAAQEAGQAAQQAAQAAQQAGQPATGAEQQATQAAGQAAEAAGQAAEAAGQAAQQAGQAAQQAGQAAQEAGQAAQQAGQQPGQQAGQPAQSAGQAAEAAGQAAEAAGQAAAQQAGQAAQQAGQQPGQQTGQQAAAMSQQAADLQQRQQALAEQMGALAQGNMTGAMTAEQAGIAAQADQLAQQTAALQQQTAALAPASAPQAAEAAAQMGQAAQSASQAASQMGAPSPGAQPSQEAASQAMAQAAQALSGLSESLAAAAAPGSGTPLDNAMAGAYDAASMAAASPSTPTASMAASAMAAASQAASASASAQGLVPGTAMGASSDPKMGTGPQAVDPRVAKLKALGITLADWARLPGTLRDQVLQAAEEGAPQEYRALIQRYFQEVARRGGTTGGE